MKVKAVGFAVLSAVLGMGAEVALLSAGAAQWRDVQASGPASTAQILTLCAALAGLAAGAWATLVVLAALLAHLPGRVGRRASLVAAIWSPVAARRLAALLVGATLAGGASVSFASAAPGASRAIPAVAHEATSPAPLVAATAPGPGPGWTPSRPLVRPQASAALVTGSAVRGTSRSRMVVHRGDTLWGIVAGYLGPEAGDADVAREWPRWHEANRDVVGDDPDRILPGQVLRSPGPSRELRP